MLISDRVYHGHGAIQRETDVSITRWETFSYPREKLKTSAGCDLRKSKECGTGAVNVRRNQCPGRRGIVGGFNLTQSCLPFRTVNSLFSPSSWDHRQSGLCQPHGWEEHKSQAQHLLKQDDKSQLSLCFKHHDEPSTPKWLDVLVPKCAVAWIGQVLVLPQHMSYIISAHLPTLTPLSLQGVGDGESRPAPPKF